MGKGFIKGKLAQELPQQKKQELEPSVGW